MKIRITPKGHLEVDDAILKFRNFEGREEKFNRAGERNFILVIPNEEIKDLLINDVNEYGVGWNVSIKESKEEGDPPYMQLKVKVKFNQYGPRVYLKSNGKTKRLDEDRAYMLDKIDIETVDLDIRPFDTIVNDKPYRTAYLDSIYVTQAVDRFEARMAMEEFPGEDEMPF